MPYGDGQLSISLNVPSYNGDNKFLHRFWQFSETGDDGSFDSKTKILS